MNYKIIEIEGIGQKYAELLIGADIATVDALLDAASTRTGRKKLADETGISEKLILKWVNHADLMRIKGVGGQFAELLEAAGVDTVKEFAHRVPANLHEKLEKTNEEKKLCGRVPSLPELEKMVSQAKTLEAKIEY